MVCWTFGSDGKKETNEIVSEWTESFKGLTASTREELTSLKETADQAGYSSVSAQLQADIDTLDSMDKEIARLLKKKQNRKLSERDKVRLQELIDTREAIEVKYHLSTADTRRLRHYPKQGGSRSGPCRKPWTGSQRDGV